MDYPVSKFLSSVRAFMEGHLPLPLNGPVVVAVSGGPDSVALLHALEALGYALHVAHLDHGTRHGESGADARFVEGLTWELDLPCTVERQSVEKESKGSGLSFEMFARKARYDFLVKVAKDVGAAAIATGHHKDDDAETVLMRILRGASVTGLGGIPPVTEKSGAPVIRPLLGCTRAEILAYLELEHVLYCSDSSNDDTDILRNRVRRDLMPYLEKNYNPQVKEALLRLSESARCDDALLDTLADDLVGNCFDGKGLVNRDLFLQSHEALQRRAILKLCRTFGTDCPYDVVTRAVKFIGQSKAGGRFDVGGNLFLRNSKAHVEFIVAGAKTDGRVVDLAVPGETRAFSTRFELRYLDKAPPGDLASYCSPNRQLFDAEALGTGLVVRHRLPGDRLAPFGMTGTKKIKDYLSDLALPMGERDAQLLVIAGDEIAWVVGRAISRNVAVCDTSKRILEIQVSAAV